MITRVEPPLVAGEVDGLRNWLAYHRATLLRKAEGLDDDQLRTPLAPSSLTIGGLLKHLAWVEDHWFGHVFLDRGYVAAWASADWDADHDWELTSSHADSGETLRGLLVDAIAASEAILEEALATDGLDRQSVRSVHGEGPCDLRWILHHMIEEYARHNGHADLIRESIDGTTGE